MNMLATRRQKVIAGGAASVILVGGAAFAYWTGSGSGTGTATTGTPAGLVVNQTATATNLFPGGPSKPLSGNFDNSNPAPVYIASVTGVVTSTSNGGCDAADFVISGTSNTPGEIPAGNAQGSWSGLSVAMTNTAQNQNACKGVTLTITYTANG